MAGRSFFRRYGTLIFTIISVSIAAYGIGKVTDRIFSLETIEVIGSDVRVNVDSVKLSRNLLFLDTGSIEKELYRTYPMFETIQLHKKFPHTLTIVLLSRRPFAMIDSGQNMLSVSDNGYVTDTPRVSVGARLPVLKFDVPFLGVGKRVDDDRVISSLSFLSASNGLVPIESIDATDSASLRAHMNGSTVIISIGSDMMRVASTLQTILTGFRIKGTMPKVIDLRFDKPVVTF